MAPPAPWSPRPPPTPAATTPSPASCPASTSSPSRPRAATRSAPPTSAPTALDSDAGAGGLTGCYTLASGETNDTVDAGFWRPAAIGDRVWLDANANGQQDAGEAGVAGVAVELYACANGQPGGSALASTTTDAAGNYGFTGLKPGDYVVKFITPAGYSLSPINIGGRRHRQRRRPRRLHRLLHPRLR
jgi:hypothetical protein